MRQVEWQQAALGFGGVQLCLAKQLTSSMSKLECGLEAKNSFVPTESWHAGSRSSLVSSESSHCAPESSRAPDPCISLLVVLHLATRNSQAKYPKGRQEDHEQILASGKAGLAPVALAEGMFHSSVLWEPTRYVYLGSASHLQSPFKNKTTKKKHKETTTKTNNQKILNQPQFIFMCVHKNTAWFIRDMQFVNQGAGHLSPLPSSF